VGPRVGLDAVKKRKIFHCRESNPGRPARCPSLYRLPISQLVSTYFQVAFIIIIIIIMAIQPSVGPWPFFFQFLDPTQSVLLGLLGRGISPSQNLYLHAEQHKHKINAHNTDIRALSGIRTNDPSARASEDSSCLIRSRGHYDRL
jgi:hypothetical protein